MSAGTKKLEEKARRIREAKEKAVAPPMQAVAPQEPTPEAPEMVETQEGPSAPDIPPETEESSEGLAAPGAFPETEEATGELADRLDMSGEAPTEKTEESPEEPESTHTADGRKYATAVSSAYPTTPKRTARKRAAKKKATKKKGRKG